VDFTKFDLHLFGLTKFSDLSSFQVFRSFKFSWCFQIFQVFFVLSLANRKILLVLAASELLCEEAWRSSSAC
jgi:hypothetical protein